MAVVATLFLAEVVTSLASGSLALLSDAGHLLTDVGSLGLAAFALRRSRAPASSRHTFGHFRAGILVAAINGIGLLAIAAALLVAALGRLTHPESVAAAPVIVVAAIAVVGNIGVVALLRGAGSDLSVQSAVLHVTADAVAALGVLVSAIVIITTGWLAADPAASILIAVLIGAGSVRLLREAVVILGEGTPRGLDVQRVSEVMLSVAGIDGVHDLHIWSLDRHHMSLSAHVAVADRALGEVTSLLRELEIMLCNQFGIEHVTLQPECPTCVGEAELYCDLDDRHRMVHEAVR